MFIETSSDNHGHERVFVSWERTDVIQITNIIFYYTIFSILTNNSLKSMGRFRIQGLLEQKTNYSTFSTVRTLLNLDFTIQNYDTKFIYDKIDTAHGDMCLLTSQSHIL